MKPSVSHLTRQMDLIPLKVLDTPINIIGAGAIGGWTCLSLAKAGFHNLTVWDFDTVDNVNMNSQFFRFSDIGKPKVDALAELVESFTKVRIVKKQERYTEGCLTGIVVCAVDSMAARKTIWEAHVSVGARTRLIVDARMGAESALLYCMDPLNQRDAETYPNSLYSDQDAVQERCTAKATIYTANLLAGMVVKAIKGYLVDQEYTRVLQWDIAKDDFVAFRRRVEPSPAFSAAPGSL